MKILLDTHALLWLMQDDARLSPEAAAAFLEPDNDLFFSTASYWEICIKQSIGKLGLAFGWQGTVDAELAANRVNWLGVNKAHCQGLLRLPHHHGDPFDRLLIAQAQVETMALLTADTNIWRYDVKTVW